MNMIKFIPPVNHDCYKILTTKHNDESSDTADEEDIYIADALITRPTRNTGWSTKKCHMAKKNRNLFYRHL